MAIKKAMVEIGDTGTKVKFTGQWTGRDLDIANLALRRELQRQISQRRVKEISDERADAATTE